MKHKITPLLALALLTVSAQGALYINAGVDNSSQTPDGQGPLGTDANYLAYESDHENAASGAQVVYNSTSFAEGGLAGTYNVGVSFSWPDATAETSKQAFNRGNTQGYDTFWQTWVGVDTRTAQGGIGGADRLMLSLTGLEANQAFTFTSYHADTQDQGGTFTVDQTLSASETSTSPFSFPSIDDNNTFTPWTTNAYTFDVTSDGSGNLDITYSRNSGTWVGINGFDLVAVPEPSSSVLIALGFTALLLNRRK